MADAEDLKSSALNGRVGSTPTSASGFIISKTRSYYNSYHKILALYYGTLIINVVNNYINFV